MSRSVIQIPPIDISRIRTGDANATADAISTLYAAFQQQAVNLATRIGSWKAVDYAAGNFTTNGGGSWTVDAADQSRYRYIVLDQLMILDVAISASTIGNLATTECRVAIPGGYLAAGTLGSQTAGVWATSAVRSMLGCFATGGGRYVSCQRWDATGGAFPSVANDFALGFTLALELTPTAFGS